MLAVYEATSWAPWALIAAVLALPLLLYPLRGLPLTRDPDWASLAVAREDNVPMGPLPAVDAKQVVVNTNCPPPTASRKGHLSVIRLFCLC